MNSLGKIKPESNQTSRFIYQVIDTTGRQAAKFRLRETLEDKRLSFFNK